MPYSIQKLRTCYQQKKSEIVQEMQACRELGHNGTREDLFSEMAYCICATGVRFELAREGIRMLKKKGFLFSGDEHFIHFYLLKGNVRFPKKKANCIIEARARFLDHG
ncbi:hypothetical protein M1O17_02295, partial [Dehalococcoidia bacterium]|nr:hypothetical protein [Dehalococcoidia bacterium]